MIAVAGLGYWGPNLARNFAELGALSWLCDLDEERLTKSSSRHPAATATSSYEELVDDASLVVDLRNATGAKGTASEKVFKL